MALSTLIQSMCLRIQLSELFGGWPLLCFPLRKSPIFLALPMSNSLNYILDTLHVMLRGLWIVIFLQKLLMFVLIDNYLSASQAVNPLLPAVGSSSDLTAGTLSLSPTCRILEPARDLGGV